MKNVKHAALEAGHPVTVVVKPDQAWQFVSRNVVIRRAGDGAPTALGRVLLADEEGVTWCRSWKGRQVDAFLVSFALETPP